MGYAAGRESSHAFTSPARQTIVFVLSRIAAGNPTFGSRLQAQSVGRLMRNMRSSSVCR
jgi:hypothetical protein